MHHPEYSLHPLISRGLFLSLVQSLNHPSSCVVRETLAVLADLSTSEHPKEVQNLVDWHAFTRILALVEMGTHSIQIAALWALSSILMHGMWKVLPHLMDNKVLDTLMLVVVEGETESTNIALEIILEILRLHEVAGGTNLAAGEMREKEFVSIVENLMGHKNPIIYQKALQILTDFFEAESNSDEDYEIIDKFVFA